MEKSPVWATTVAKHKRRQICSDSVNTAFKCMALNVCLPNTKPSS